MKSIKKILVWLAGLTLVMVLLGAVLGSGADEKSPPKSASTSSNMPIEPVVKNAESMKPPEQSAAATPVTFDFGPKQFAKQLSGAVQKITGEKGEVPKIEMQQGEVNNSFTLQLDEHAGLVSAVDKKSGKILYTTLVADLGQIKSEHYSILVGVLMMALQPDSLADQRGSTLKRLVNETLEKGKGEALLWPVRYQMEKVTGSMLLIASPAK